MMAKSALGSARWIAHHHQDVSYLVLFTVILCFLSIAVISSSEVQHQNTPDGWAGKNRGSSASKIQDKTDQKEESIAQTNQLLKQPRNHRRNRTSVNHYRAKKTVESEINKINEKKSSTNTEGLSPWSPWSKCNKRCRQVRHRECTDASSENRCAHHVLKQERKCRKSRCRREDRGFHVVLPPKRDGWEKPPSDASPHQQQSDVRVLLSLYSIFYSSWSRWSPCSKSCTTTRYRTCRFQVACGNTVLNEEAYCYSKGTDCEKWYSANAHQSKDEDDGNEAKKSTVIRSASGLNRGQRRAKNGSDSMTRPECGVSSGGLGAGSGAQYGLQLRITGGREATPGRWPWQVAILNRYKEAFCGGTLVGARWVLTAAHCFRKRLYVRIGEYDLVEDDGTEIDFRVEEVFVHPNYDPDTVDNDVALLRLPEAINLDQQSIRLACLPQPGQSLPVNQKCTIIGWGKERSSHVFGTEVLHEAEVPIVKTSVCRDVYEDYIITENMFCAGYRKGRIDSCAGDSGGPLLCSVGDRWTIFGITSFGEGCGKRGKYGIYTKVPNYVDWIQRVISVNEGA